jgi:LacI family transcriptional regulator
MEDVARLAEVGTMTVSRLLNGNTAVSPEATKRIHWAIEKLGYQRNDLARAFRGQQTKTIGVLIPHLADPFFARCAYEVDTVAKEHGYSSIVTSTNSDEREEENESLKMLRRHVEGIVIIPARDGPSYLSRAEFRKMPIVALDRPATKNIDTVLIENKAAAQRGIEHLIWHGHKQVAFLGLRPDLYTMRTRYQGYRLAMMAAGLQPSDYVSISQVKDAAALLQNLLRQKTPPTAIFAASNLVTRMLLSASHEGGSVMPKEVGFIGFDDIEFASLLSPQLTVLRQPVAEMAREGARMLFDRITKSTGRAVASHRILAVELVIRQSCGCVG